MNIIGEIVTQLNELKSKVANPLKKCKKQEEFWK
jgi:hypothetical protein